MKKKVLVLGATGRVGPGLVEDYFKEYSKDYELIIGVHKISKEDYGLKTRKFDLNSMEKLKKAFKGIDVVVHLAAQSNPEAEFDEILNPNIIGAYNVFEAARQSKVKRVVFASSVHTIRGYPLGKKVKHNEVPMPTNFYGASKVWGENLCYIYSHKFDMSCLAIRIGAYVSNDMRKVVCFERETYDYVISQRDMSQLIHKCIMASKDVKFGILAGVSNNKRNYMDLKFTKKLVGYKPEDDAFKMCREIKEGKIKRFFWGR
jgi:uronate dehydrogenase